MAGPARLAFAHARTYEHTVDPTVLQGPPGHAILPDERVNGAPSEITAGRVQP